MSDSKSDLPVSWQMNHTENTVQNYPCAVHTAAGTMVRSAEYPVRVRLGGSSLMLLRAGVRHLVLEEKPI